ncbi:hypothetical protein COV28_00960 [candidate division WWE3 bacterium CG10_big_fil_rev_8_21_14_0_10_48_23]|uniref:N-acetyltransferase domain-containing protein n=1 Tax=candidate division WWE3 bacterium CG_4_9_14_0_2_um_filter_48_10 TaxID=1975078 RepID=A0A2M8EIX7_UNCKA|nr:MAG: hypothetical protein COY35_00890 [candidate division WWE3 bacterium CG_4_10_14_0_2_um_filter_47_8]PJC22693.1 MAG: hypothetical protein CO059_01945 [candidate division WWE3 bacterium CG_4_9_14_0_2_um_filter_48_10]PJE52110.1 MAG: hypothetical protein COV28_00960 [candidate division WWE3 bacterium CG10_big_fil_rev_8_21_14_0_10_48_23]
MKIRKATKFDIPILQIIKPSLPVKAVENRLERQKRGEVGFLILEENGAPVSFTLLKWRGKSTHPEYPDIEDLFTKKSERGKSYASILIEECEKRARNRDYTKIGLAVNPTENPKAKEFYERLGYRHDGRDAYLDGTYNGVEDWVIDMEKEL